MNQRVAVIGSGSWGTALAILLATKGYSVRLWSYLPQESLQLAKDRENKALLPGAKFPDLIECSPDMGYCIEGACYVISAVPSKAVRSTAKEIAKHLKDQIVITVSKGLEADSLLTLTQVIEEEIPDVRLAALSGPSHAEEVARHMPTTNVAASKDLAIAKQIQDLFMYQNFRVYVNPDVLGVELGGSLKNVIALCAGIADGLGLGDNAKAALMTRGMTEISRLGIAMGAKLETFFGLTGMGDLIVTCTSMHSRNRRAGILIGQGKPVQKALEEVKMVVEGVPATKAAYHLAKKMGVEMPIVNAAYGILFEGKSAKDAVLNLMTRSKKHEMEDLI